MIRIRRTAAALAAGALLAVVAPATAHAESYKHVDARGDVQRYVFAEDTEEPVVEPAPRVSEGDIRASVVSHNTRAVVLTLKFVSLDRSRQLRVYLSRIRTNESLRRDVALFTYPGAQRGEVSISRPNGVEVDCAGMRHRLDYDRDLVRVRVPRACLSHPRWVQAGLGAFRVSQDGERIFADDAQRTAGDLERGFKRGPRVRRG